MAKIVVGLSGGVDSSVAAWLLKEEGHEVIGIFMRNWHDDSVIIDDECPWIDDSNDAMMVADMLDIPFQVLDLSSEYKTRIVDYMFSEYQAGRTPNPDILCNREIKFDTFLKYAEKLGAEYVATGHYCRRESVVSTGGKTINRLLAGNDNNKDQSYFLCSLNQQQLSKALFPIGHLTKPEVRRIAQEQKLVTADKKDSQGLCFIGKVKLPVFLQQKLAVKPGRIIEIDGGHAVYETEVSPENLLKASEPMKYTEAMGIQVGDHQGAHFYTIGQRKGLHVGGRPLPSFVIATDVERNLVFTGQGEKHPGLYRSTLKVSTDEVHWVRPDLALRVGESKSFDCRIRYRQPLNKAILSMTDKNLFVQFEKPQRGIAPGQFVVWYNEDELVGSGVISV